MRKYKSTIVLLAVGLGCLVIGGREASAQAQTAPSYVPELKRVLEENAKAGAKKDLEAAMSWIHPKSPSYSATERGSKQVFATDLDLDHKIEEFRFIGADETYAVARFKLKTTRVNGKTPFKDNEADILIAFRKDGEQWKVWNQTMLDLKFLP